MASFVHHYGYLAVFLLVGIESLGIPLPGETALITASLYAGATHNLGIAGVVGAAVAGAIIGDNIGYLLGHWGGYRLLIRYGQRIRLDQRRVKVARYLFRHNGGRVVFAGRFVSILRTYAAFLAGTSRMPWRRFLVFNAAGGVVWASLYGILGDELGNEADRVSTPLAVGFGVIGAVILVVTGVAVHRGERGLEAAAEAEFPGPLEGFPGGPPL